jgi:hypothetical protein
MSDGIMEEKSALELSLEEDIEALATQEKEGAESDKSETEEIVEEAINESEGGEDSEDAYSAEDSPSDEDEDDEEEDDLDPEDYKKKEAFVKQRLKIKESNNRIKDLEKQLQEVARQTAHTQGMLDARTQAQPQEQSNPEPDKELDPEAWTEWKLSEQDKLFQQQALILEQNQREQQILAARNQLAQLEQGFSETEKSYFDAKKYYINSLSEELKISYPNASDQEILAEIDQKILLDASDVVRQNQNKNPAETFFKLAKARGFTEKPLRQVHYLPMTLLICRSWMLLK